MGYVKQADLIETAENFRDYLKTKNAITRRMLELYEHCLEQNIGFFNDPDFAMFGRRDSPESKLCLPVLISSKKPGERGRVFIDTGYFEITEKAEVVPSRSCFTAKRDFSQYAKDGIDGLRFMKTELDQTINLYEQIFGKGKK